MHDLKRIRNQPQVYIDALKKRGMDDLITPILSLDEEHRQLTTEVQKLRSQRNHLAQEFQKTVKQGLNVDVLKRQSDELKIELADLESRSQVVEDDLKTKLSYLPNSPQDDVIVGVDETENKVEKIFGSPRTFDFEIRSHDEIGVGLGLMDFEASVRLAGSRFVVMKGLLAKLERALGQFMLDVHTKQWGYEEISGPLLANDASLFGVGHLPKFADDMFQTKNGYWLISTAEVMLTNLCAQQILPSSEFPKRLTALTPCFRSEAGAAGRDNRGIIRQHQFWKVELVTLCTSEQEEAEYTNMQNAAESILEKLGLPYRKVLLCTGDMGFSSQKTYDYEVWMPSQNTYREISSCSMCGDFQARRMNGKYKDSENEKHFIRTMNGSGLAVGRTLAAILENYQNKDGSFSLPEVLKSYMN
ncbi:MAG: serine--tRNA ligase [Candidatus Puniceispirillum sp.]|nr:serine--tRNA ligase [Candidatus Pelagibacter sp.]MBA4283604.1 serine--tRNA ligase [Candidatus Puniceispirillum sp.]